MHEHNLNIVHDVNLDRPLPTNKFKPINFCTINTQCLRNKVPELEVICELNQLDILCVCEHWLVAAEIQYFSSLANLKLVSHYCRQRTSGGGVAVFIKQSFSFRELNLLQFCEDLHGEFSGVMLLEPSLLVLAMYRSPNGNLERFFFLLELCLNYLVSLNLPIIIGTDHNVNLLQNSREAVDFLNVLRGYNIYCSVIEPTRGNSSLDTFLSNLDACDYISSVSVDHLADHKHVLLTLTKYNSLACNIDCRPKPIVSRILFRSFSESAYQSFLRSLHMRVPLWFNTVVMLRAEESFDYFFANFKQTFDSCFPVRGKTIKTDSVNTKIQSKVTTPTKDWYTDELASLRNSIVLLHDMSYLRPELIPYLRARRKEYRCKLREAKQAANAVFISRAANPCKAAWALINHCRVKKNTCSSNFATADDFNLYFIESVNNILSNIPDHAMGNPGCLGNIPTVVSEFQWHQVSIEAVSDIADGIRASNSKDFYDMTSNFIKIVFQAIAPLFTHLVNSCIMQGVFPDVLKIARIVPIFKKGSNNDVSSFRPIALVPVLAKLFEVIMFRQLYDYFEMHRLLVPAQFGFRKGRSTVAAVESLLDKILQSFESKRSTSVILCDLSRAFDCISHDILLSKLEKYGLRGGALRLVRSYLSNRKQVVSWNGQCSSALEVKQGVPQGSVLGPLLFIIAINDLYYSVSGKTILFADDTTLFSHHSSILAAENSAKELLGVASQWFVENKLALNESKTQFLTFSLARSVSVRDPIKLLGFTLDSGLVWDSHISSLCVKLSRVLYLLRRLANEVDEHFLRIAYFAFFHAHLSYGTRLWGHSSLTNKVLLIQKKALRLISKAGFHDHCRPLFIQRKILTVHSVYILQCIIAIRDSLDSFVTNADVHNHATRFSSNLFLPRNRLSKVLKCYPVSGVKMFNALPPSIRCLPRARFIDVMKDWLVMHPLYSVTEFYGLDFLTLTL